MKGIILHGGHGTRLRPLTHTGPKQLLPIGNKPMSEYCLETIIDAGIKDVAIVIGGIGSEKVKEYYKDGKDFGIKITYIVQESPKGIADAINLCKEYIGDSKFLVFLGDNIILKSILSYKENFEKSDVDASVLLCEVEEPSRFGIALVENKIITKIIEKPKKPLSNLAVTGIYFLTPKIFEIIKDQKPSWRNELEITDALDSLLEKKYNISYNIITDYWKDTGTPEDIIHANKTILENSTSRNNGKISKKVKHSGIIIIEKGAIIESDVELIGPVLVGKNSIIRKGSILGPNATIGNDCLIEKAKIKNSIIMNDSKIMVDAIFSDSIISANCIIENKINSLEKKVLLGEGTRLFI